MNNPLTFQLGWALFAVGTLSGAYIGYNQAVAARVIRVKALEGQLKDRNDSLEKLEAKWRAEGNKRFKPKGEGNPPAAGTKGSKGGTDPG